MPRKKKSKSKPAKTIKSTKKQHKVKKPKKFKKKINRREQAKYPALEKKFNLLSRQDMLDFDYIEKLNDTEKEWLNKFVEEEVNASFRHKKPLNKTSEQRKRCYTNNNARNRDVLTRNKAIGNVDNLENVKETSQLNPEMMLIRAQEKALNNMKNTSDFDNTFNRANKSKNPA